jgi:hypothetical protein
MALPAPPRPGRSLPLHPRPPAGRSCHRSRRRGPTPRQRARTAGRRTRPTAVSARPAGRGSAHDLGSEGSAPRSGTTGSNGSSGGHDERGRARGGVSIHLAGRSAAWQRACFGSRRPAVRIRPPRPSRPQVDGQLALRRDLLDYEPTMCVPDLPARRRDLIRTPRDRATYRVRGRRSRTRDRNVLPQSRRRLCL